MTLLPCKSTIILSKSPFLSKLIKPKSLFQVTPRTVCSRVFDFNYADDRMKCQGQQWCWYCCYGYTPIPQSMLEAGKTDGQPHPHSMFVLSCADYVTWCKLLFYNDYVINKSCSPNANWRPQLKMKQKLLVHAVWRRSLWLANEDHNKWLKAWKSCHRWYNGT